MNTKDIAIRIAKKGYRFITHKQFLNPPCIIDRQQANDEIFNLLNSDKPCMISRFGTTELNCINNYLCVHSQKNKCKKIIDYITDYTHTPWWNKDHFKKMSLWSGIFPPCQDTAERFSERYLHDIPEIDLLGSFQYYEKFMPLKKNLIKVQLETLYPFFVERPWTRILENQKVLVIHPFEATIKHQYDQREHLFSHPQILPSFQLITFKAVQSIANSQTQFDDWFKALAWQEKEIEKIDFDICLLGCGAYGMPLAAHVKRMGKKAIHIGGGLQLMFGILGNRWVKQYKDIQVYRPNEIIDTNYRKLFNEYWIYPLPEDCPSGAEKVEGACYWK